MGNGKSVIIWIALLCGLVFFFDAIQGSISGIGNGQELAFSDFLNDVESGRVEEVNIRGPYIEGKYVSGQVFSTYNTNYPGLIDSLKNNQVRVSASSTDTAMSSFMGILISWFPILLLVGVWIFFMRQMQGGGKGGAMGFGKSRARMMTEHQIKKTFDDVAGVDEAKEELHEIVDFLKSPQKFRKLGGKIPKGCLLVGPPGTGKTLLARAIAGEANVPFFSISGSDFVEMFVGVGASRVRDMFEQGKKNAPCIIFIDEIDAVGRHRGAGLGGGNDEREQTLNQLLVEMDGFADNEGVIIIAATNRPDVLDPALLRPGRFDRQIVVPAPDIRGREKIVSVHLKGIPTAPDVDPIVIARGTPGFSGADLANVVNEAALLAARKNKNIVTMQDLEDAKDKVLMGVERKSMAMSEEEKKLTAYHEAGHAVVSLNCEASDPIHKATIIPRGRALGLVMRLPERDKLSVTREKLHADISVAMGGRVAEEYIFGYDKVTTGASSDIQQATKMAKAMVTEWGMSDKIGPLFHSSNNEEVFLGHSVTKQQNMSEETSKLIDAEIKEIVESGYSTAKNILKKHKKQLVVLAEGLLEFETLSGKEIKALLSGEDIHKLRQSAAQKNKLSSSVPSSKKNESSSQKSTSNDSKNSKKPSKSASSKTDDADK